MILRLLREKQKCFKLMLNKLEIQMNLSNRHIKIDTSSIKNYLLLNGIQRIFNDFKRYTLILSRFLL